MDSARDKSNNHKIIILMFSAPVGEAVFLRLRRRTAMVKGETAMTKATPDVIEATFGRVFNLGNYETFRVELKATVGPNQTPEAVVEALDAMTVKMRRAHKDGEPFKY
jgi:hypothetical protein